MNKKDAQELAEKAGFTWLTTKDYGDELLIFAELVAAAEREACAKLCEDDGYEVGAALAGDIRARSNASNEVPALATVPLD